MHWDAALVLANNDSPPPSSLSRRNTLLTTGESKIREKNLGECCLLSYSYFSLFLFILIHTHHPTTPPPSHSPCASPLSLSFPRWTLSGNSLNTRVSYSAAIQFYIKLKKNIAAYLLFEKKAIAACASFVHRVQKQPDFFTNSWLLVFHLT